MKTLGVFMLLLESAIAQTGVRAVIRTTGQLDTDGSALYNVFVATRDEPIEDVVIAAALPPGTRFLEAVHKPQDGTYDGVKDNTIAWTVTRIDRETLLGPFVFRAKLDGTAPEIPASIAAAVSYQRPVPELVEFSGEPGALTPLAEQGSISIDQRGTLDAGGQNAPAFIGNTGVALYVPEGAIQTRTTITFRRLPVDETKLPKTDPSTWWCAKYQMTAEPQVNFSEPVSFALPSRRAVTPGLNVSVFTSQDEASWEKRSSTALAPFGRNDGSTVGGFGPGAVVITCFTGLAGTICTTRPLFGFGGFGGFGYLEQDNQLSRISGSALSNQGSPSAADFLTTPPSIITVLIGRR